jgi:large subunit ribosomal protein L24
MYKIRKNETVQVVKGKDKGKKGKVLRIDIESNKALVEGVNMVKKHKRQTRQDQSGGIVSVEIPIALSNLMLICTRCNRASRIGFKINQADGSKVRFCKSCKEVI